MPPTVVLQPELDDLLEEMKSAPEIYRPSPFWQELTAVGLRQLEEGGFENFKRSVNMTYFNWGVLGILQHQFLPVLSKWSRRPSWSVFRAKFPKYRSDVRGGTGATVSNYRLKVPTVKSFSPASAQVYKLYVAMLYELVAACDRSELLDTLEEPELGNPFSIRYRDRWTSQDLCNSVQEFYAASGDLTPDQAYDVAELGAGYGRVGYVFLRALPRSTYTVIDIPPALNVAQEYLSRVFPDESIFRFRHFTRFEDVREEFERARIRVLAAHQIELVPAKVFDLFLTISSLHEMSRAQIQNYLAQVDRVCRGRFYSKQWRVSQASVNGHVIRESDYPIPASWNVIYRRRHPVQRMFFEALYDVR
jgi:putative sugar O-methyltransferase